MNNYTERETLKYKLLLDNHVNGNLSDFRRGLSNLTKIQLIRFLHYCEFYGFNRPGEITAYDIARHLELERTAKAGRK